MNQPKHKILLVDDEPNILMILEILMRPLPCSIEKAANGSEALRKARSFLPDVILLDVMMPGMDGFEVAMKIREDARLDHCRIIFLTARGTREDRFRGYETGGEIYMTKPFDNEELIHTVKELLEYG